ncbi:MAG TPA: hypothetical protein ENH82_15085 [bacterium]|nr:hypothetical protein [bacterium]
MSKMEAIDRKYKFIGFNPSKENPTIHSEMDAFIFLATDEEAPDLLNFYITRQKMKGAGKAQIACTELLRERVMTFQRLFPKKVKVADVHDEEGEVLLAPNEKVEFLPETTNEEGLITFSSEQAFHLNRLLEKIQGISEERQDREPDPDWLSVRNDSGDALKMLVEKKAV